MDLSTPSVARPAIHVLNGSGHLTLTWDPSDPSDVARARVEVEALRSVGYAFFAVDGPVTVEQFERGEGSLDVRRVDDPMTSTVPTSKETHEIEDPPKQRPGRSKGSPNRAKPPEPSAKPIVRLEVPRPTQHVAVRPMRGG